MQDAAGMAFLLFLMETGHSFSHCFAVIYNSRNGS
jgi:hypothetical protein